VLCGAKIIPLALEHIVLLPKEEQSGPQVTCTENFVKFGLWLSRHASGPTHKQKHSSQYFTPCKVTNKKHLKYVGLIRYFEPPLHCQSPSVASRTPAIAIAQAGVRCPRQQQQRQRVTEGTAMAPWNGSNNNRDITIMKHL